MSDRTACVHARNCCASTQSTSVSRERERWRGSDGGMEGGEGGREGGNQLPERVKKVQHGLEV